MKIDKRYKKFYEIGVNKYYVLDFNKELYLATETILELPKKFKIFNNNLSQGFKLLEITPPILMLFRSLLDCNVRIEDKDFSDMTRYEKIDNTELRKTIKDTYQTALDQELKLMEIEFNEWCDNIIDNNPDCDMDETIKINKIRYEKNIETIKNNNIINYIDTIKPCKKEDNDVLKKMITSGLEFLYTQKIGSTQKIHYVYDLDVFGTLTIYKITCVKDVVKSIETFIYNRELIEEFIAYIINNNLM